MIVYQTTGPQGDKVYTGEQFYLAKQALDENGGGQLSRMKIRVTKENMIAAISGWGGFADEVHDYIDGEWR